MRAVRHISLRGHPPGQAAAIVGREDVRGRLRHRLNVESGRNDGLARPVVLVLARGSMNAWTAERQVAEQETPALS